MSSAKRTARDEGLRQLPSGRWQARYRDPETRKTIPRTFESKTEAKRWRRAQLAALDAGAHVDPTDTTTVAQYALRWVEVRDVRASTEARYRAIVRTHLDGTTLGGMALGKVKPTHVREWLTERNAVLAPSTLRYVRTFLAAVFASARDDRLITWSPVEGVKVKAAGRSMKAFRSEVLSDDQIEALRTAMPEHYHALVTLLAVAGLRIGEALALTVEDIDREAGVIRVRRTLAPNGQTAGPVKSAQSERDVPVPRDLLATLSAHMLAHPPLDHDLGRLVFSTPTGLPVRYHRLRWQFEQAATKAKVEGATPHALRHRAGSVLLNAGVPAASVARALGHTERVLLDVYSHALPTGDDLLRAAMTQASGSGTDVARGGLRVAQ